MEGKHPAGQISQAHVNHKVTSNQCQLLDQGDQGLNKGAFSPEEDKKLICYMRVYGRARNTADIASPWSLVPAKAGLNRCGKSCRLRWCNYLRPGLKKEPFSDEEERLILSLRETLGNRWCKIAERMPGRTDNAIKNHWNTHLKKRAAREEGIDPGSQQPACEVEELGASKAASKGKRARKDKGPAKEEEQKEKEGLNPNRAPSNRPNEKRRRYIRVEEEDEDEEEEEEEEEGEKGQDEGSDPGTAASINYATRKYIPVEKKEEKEKRDKGEEEEEKGEGGLYRAEVAITSNRPKQNRRTCIPAEEEEEREWCISPSSMPSLTYELWADDPSLLAGYIAAWEMEPLPQIDILALTLLGQPESLRPPDPEVMAADAAWPVRPAVDVQQPDQLPGTAAAQLTGPIHGARAQVQAAMPVEEASITEVRLGSKLDADLAKWPSGWEEEDVGAVGGVAAALPVPVEPGSVEYDWVESYLQSLGKDYGGAEEDDLAAGAGTAPCMKDCHAGQGELDSL